jgi:large subunit ribosomal protein L53
VKGGGWKVEGDGWMGERIRLTSGTEDGKELTLDLEKMRITDVTEEVNRHSRILARKEELDG